MSTKPRRPAGLKRSARTWDRIAADYDLRADELRLLEDACREADLIDRMQGELNRARSMYVKGSMGQTVVNPLVAELRAHRTALKGLWVALRFPDPEEDGAGGVAGQAGAASSAARALANQRWGLKR